MHFWIIDYKILKQNCAPSNGFSCYSNGCIYTFYIVLWWVQLVLRWVELALYWVHLVLKWIELVLWWVELLL